MPRNRLATFAAIATLVVLATSCSNDPKADPGVDLGKVKLVAALQPFDKCDDFLSYVKGEATKQVTAYGLGGSGGGVIAYDAGAPVTSAAAGMTEDRAVPSAATEAAPKAAGDTASSQTNTAGTGTNNQEADVDEADIVKTDGNRIVTLRNNELIVVTLVDGAPHLTARLSLGDVYASQLFLLPDRAYVLGTTGYVSDTSNESGVSIQQAIVLEVSLTGAPSVAHTTKIDGNLVDGRMANGTLRLVLTTPGATSLGFVYPSGDSQKSIETAQDANKRLIADSTVADWVPSRTTDGGNRAPLLDCDHLYRPAELAGFSMLSILTISDGLGSLTGTGLLADGQTTYASTDHLYVATNQWSPLSDEVPSGAAAKRSPAATAEHTDVHAFSIAGTAPAAYEASGRVDGHVLNQYSMSEANDDLRIATTVGPNFGGATPTPECPPDADCAISGAVSDRSISSGDSRIVVLRRDGELLQEIGKVDGLGAGEQIKSVRYVGTTAYIVTFRQTDPFYVVDLTDPNAPKKLGELKVPGFSSYLHPVGDHLVLGVGSAATDQGRITGAKLSLYDTSDPASPKEITTWTAKDLSFQVDGDPHAFSWDADRSTAYLPYYGNCTGDVYCGQVQSGVLVVKVADGKITEAGRITHADRTSSPDAPADTTTTVPSTIPETTVPDTTIPSTTIPDTTSTTIPDTTTTTATAPPVTVTQQSGDGSSSSAGSAGSADPSSIASPPIGIAPPMPSGPYCDPAACDPAPVDYLPTITRVFVIGDRVITLSDFGIAAHDVGTLKLAGFAAF